MKTVKNVDFKDKKVIMRVDFNVSLDDNGNITDDTRIRETIPTIKYVLKECKQLILMSHLGSPKGIEEKLKMDRVAVRLQSFLPQEVTKLDDCINIEIPEDKKIVLLENLRFHPEEEKNDAEFAKKLASHADIYVNDAFGTMHRAHASTAGIAQYIQGCVGFLVEKELKNLAILEEPKRPYIAVLGGAKISTKIKLIDKLLKKVDFLLLGGAMIFTFYKAKGYEIGKSKYEPEQVELAKFMLNNSKIILPTDIVAANEIKEDAATLTVNANEIPEGWIGLDIGPESVKRFKEILEDANTVLWNGPLGYYEIKKFSVASDEIAKYISQLNAVTVLGGGDTITVIEKLGIKDKFTHVSTGGGAMLEYLSGIKLPAIAALEENEKKFW